MWGLVGVAISVAVLVGYATTHWFVLLGLAASALFLGFAWKTK